MELYRAGRLSKTTRPSPSLLSPLLQHLWWLMLGLNLPLSCSNASCSPWSPPTQDTACCRPWRPCCCSRSCAHRPPVCASACSTGAAPTCCVMTRWSWMRKRRPTPLPPPCPPPSPPPRSTAGALSCRRRSIWPPCPPSLPPAETDGPQVPQTTASWAVRSSGGRCSVTAAVKETAGADSPCLWMSPPTSWTYSLTWLKPNTCAQKRPRTRVSWRRLDGGSEETVQPVIKYFHVNNMVHFSLLCMRFSVTFLFDPFLIVRNVRQWWS